MTQVHPLERFLAILGALACLLITVAVWLSVSAYQSMWPLPALYFIELPVLSIFCAVLFIQDRPLGPLAVWALVGILLAFAFMAAFSVGFAYLPVALIFASVAISSVVRLKLPLAPCLGAFVIAAITQVALIFAAIGLIYPAG